MKGTLRWVGPGIVLATGLAWTARAPSDGATWRVVLVVLHLVASGALVAALLRWEPTTRHVILTAVALRILVFPMLPVLSDDGFRYIWDGVVRVEADVSPYLVLPSDPSLENWQSDPVYGRLNSPDYYSVYPPISQLVFAASAFVYADWGWQGSWYVLKAILLALELTAIAILSRLVGPKLLALYALNPLVVLEVAGQGHTEGIVVFGIALVLWGLTHSPAATGIGAVVATLTKLAPAPVSVISLRRGGWRSAVWMMVTAFVATALFWSPSALGNAGQSLGLFLGTLDQYALPYRSLKALTYPLFGDLAGRISSLVLTALWALTVGIALLSDDGSRRSAIHAIAVTLVGAAAVTSTLHPWYFVPVLFVATLIEDRALRWALVWIATISSVTYLGYVLEGTDWPVMIVGWGGAALIYFWVGREAAISRTRSGVVVRASIHVADG
ncbi:glycosyltransferase 87 family protein [Rubrivirga sp.]|uniref:glycosyltransferase 87 family protein n=1 Tax=Rubrivirga sp. TaxID=1885344 RepID=UPI003C791AF1